MAKSTILDLPVTREKWLDSTLVSSSAESLRLILNEFDTFLAQIRFALYKQKGRGQLAIKTQKMQNSLIVSFTL